ncbi:hypothetical protein GCM10007417_16560 [Glycocaulis alkaliphilus]|nr:hypothetical protein GCM10007417_16560 [Glycocaulis alkaliphilus]
MGHAQISRTTYQRADGLHTLPVPHGARKAARGRPAPVPVHNYGNVARHRDLATGFS